MNNEVENSNNNNSTDRDKFNAPRETVKLTDALEKIKNDDAKVSTVKTFQSDIAGTVKTDNVSMIKMALAEKARQEAQGTSYAELDAKKPFNKIYIVAFLIILLIGGAIGFVYWYFNRPAKPTLEQTLVPQEPEVIYSETQSSVSIEGKAVTAIVEDIRKETLSKLDLGTIKRVFLTTGNGTSTRSVNTERFFSAIRSNAPRKLIDSLEPYFVLGGYSYAPHDTFIIFKVRSYDNAFAGMIAWEDSMELDLGKILLETPELPRVRVREENATTSNSTTTAITDSPRVIGSTTIRSTSDPEQSVFKDKIIQNKDTRVLVDKDGKMRFLYSFIDKDTLVIVTTEKGFKELITRMTIGRVRR